MWDRVWEETKHNRFAKPGETLRVDEDGRRERTSEIKTYCSVTEHSINITARTRKLHFICNVTPFRYILEFEHHSFVDYSEHNGIECAWKTVNECRAQGVLATRGHGRSQECAPGTPPRRFLTTVARVCKRSHVGQMFCRAGVRIGRSGLERPSSFERRTLKVSDFRIIEGGLRPSRAQFCDKGARVAIKTSCKRPAVENAEPSPRQHRNHAGPGRQRTLRNGK